MERFGQEAKRRADLVAAGIVKKQPDLPGGCASGIEAVISPAAAVDRLVELAAAGELWEG